jgi:hypothetical protein
MRWPLSAVAKTSVSYMGTGPGQSELSALSHRMIGAGRPHCRSHSAGVRQVVVGGGQIGAQAHFVEVEQVSGDGAIRSPRRHGHRYQGDRLETVPLCRHRMTKRGGDGDGLGGGCELVRRPEVVWGVRRPCRISRVGSGNDNGVTPQQATVAKRVGAVVGGGDARGDCGLRQRCV